ncbi:MAG: DUF1854 domain-containing protein [Clostridia bacterium]|nr:DUF1854 domain-containing protein [Clostridia bacterium]MBQ6931944.1 DUF1854 domain-containing protein [Clostridia bacterium]
MARNFVDPNAVRFTVNDKIYVDAELYTGEKFTMLEPHRLFPVSGLMKYISLLDEEGNEKMIIRDLDQLMPESKEVILNCLNERYMIPKITRLIKRTEKFKIWMWTVDTDRGEYTFEIINSYQSIKILYDGRILIKDGNDNRYEIPDLYALDKRSIKLILPDV